MNTCCWFEACGLGHEGEDISTKLATQFELWINFFFFFTLCLGYLQILVVLGRGCLACYNVMVSRVVVSSGSCQGLGLEMSCLGMWTEISMLTMAWLFGVKGTRAEVGWASIRLMLDRLVDVIYLYKYSILSFDIGKKKRIEGQVRSSDMFGSFLGYLDGVCFFIFDNKTSNF